ncbi:MAG: hypothetical protein RI894_364 [Bacteroidota bacterium]
MHDGSWHYDEADKKEAAAPPAPPQRASTPISTPPATPSIASKSEALPIKANTAVASTKNQTIIVDGVEKIVPTGADPLKIASKKDTVPAPPVGMEYRTILVDGVEKSILVQTAKKNETPKTPPVKKPETPVSPPNTEEKKTAFEELGTVIPPARIDTSIAPQALAEVREGADFLTPEEEYRLKAAATQAGTKQDENIKIKTEKVKQKKQPKPEKAVVKEVKKPKAAAAGCELVVNEIDEFTGKEKKSTKARVFFTHTPEAAKKYMRSDDYLTCTGYLSRVGAYKTLSLTIVVDTPFGQSEYGEISTNSSLMIRMIDGTTVELYCDKGDAGHVDKIKNQTIYNVFYILESSFEAQLKRGEVSRARLVWSVGFEDYELYNLDFFTEQFGCIN